MAQDEKRPERRTGSAAAAARIKHQQTWVDLQVQQAMARGEFDDLPGAGKPLKDLGDPDDPMWWLRRYAEREHLDMSGALPPALQLRKEAASYPESLADLRTEAAVRHVLGSRDRVMVNLTHGGEAAAARWLFTVFAVLAAVGFAASYRASRQR